MNANTLINAFAHAALGGAEDRQARHLSHRVAWFHVGLASCVGHQHSASSERGMCHVSASVFSCLAEGLIHKFYVRKSIFTI